MLPPTRDEWYKDPNFNANEEEKSSAPPPTARDSWWNESTPTPQPPQSAPPPTARDDWWNVQPPQGGDSNPPSGDEVPYIGDTYAPPQAGVQAFTPRLNDLPPLPSTFGQASESPEIAQRVSSGNPIEDWMNNTPAAKALRGDVAGAALDYGKNLSPAAPVIADSIAAGLKGAYDATPNIGNALMGKPYDSKEALNEGFGANIFNPFKNPISRGVMMAINEPFMQTYGKAYGAARSILDDSVAKSQKVYRDAVAKGDAAPIAAAKAGYDFLQNSPTAPGMGLSGLAYRTRQELKQGKLTEPQKFVDYIANEIDNGRTSFENLHPIEQIIAGFLLPDPIFSTMGATAKFGTAQKAIAGTIDRALLKAEFGGNFGDLNSLIITGKKAVPRTIEDVIKSGDLTPTNTALDGMFGKRTPLTISTLLSETTRTVVNNLARGLDEQGKLSLFAALTKKAGKDATWITDAQKIGLDPKSIEAMGAEFVAAADGSKARIFSPLESLYGEATGKVLETIFTDTKPESMSALLETVARGLAENATDVERAAAKTASGQFAKMFADASDKIVGVDRTVQTGNALTKAWRGYQNFHSGLQLFTLGFPVRNIVSGMTDTVLAKAGDPLGGLKWLIESKAKNLSIPELFYQKTGAYSESLNRTTGNMRDYENVSKNIIQRGLEKLGVPEKITTFPQRFQAAGEQAMHANIIYSQRLKVFDNLGGARLIDASLIKALENVAGKGKADALAKALSVAKSPGEVRMIANNALGGKDYLNIQPEFAPSLERAGLKDPLVVAANKAKTAQQYAKEADKIGREYFTSLADAKNLFTHDSDIAFAEKYVAEQDITLESKSVRDAMLEANSFSWDNQKAKEAMKQVTTALLDRAGTTPENLKNFNDTQMDVAKTFNDTAQLVRTKDMLAREGKIDAVAWKKEKGALWDDVFAYAYSRWESLAQDLNAQVVSQGGKPADLRAVKEMYIKPDITNVTAQEAAFRSSPEAKAAVAQAGVESGAYSNLKLKDVWDYKNNQPSRVLDGVSADVNEQAFLEKAKEILDRAGYQGASPTTVDEFDTIVLNARKAQDSATEAAKIKKDLLGGKYNPPVPQGTLDPNTTTPPVVNAAGQIPLPNVPYDPVQAEKLNAAMDALRDLRAQRDFTVKNWGVKFSDATPEQAAAIQAVIKDYEMRFNSLNLLADRVGTQMADQVLFNFGDKRSVDQYLSAAVAYPYWYTRNMLRQTSKLWENPHQLWALQNMHDQVKEWNAQNGITDPAKQYNLNVGDVSVPIFGNFDTSASLDTQNYRNRVRDEDPLGWVFNTAEGIMSPHAGLYDIMGALAYMSGKPELALTYAAGTSTPTNMLGAGAMKLGVSGNLAHPIEKVKSAVLPQYGMFFVKDDKGQDIYIGGASDQKKMQMELAKMVKDGGVVNGKPVSREAVQQAQVLLHKMGDSSYQNDPNYAQAWAILKEAAVRSQTNRIITTSGTGDITSPVAGATLLSYFGGPGARYSVEAEKEIEASQAKLRAIMAQKDGLIAAGKKDEYSQLMRDYWTSPDNQLYALYKMGNSLDVEEAYAWSVLSRMGVGIVDNPAAKAAGMNRELLNAFYAEGGIPKGWTMLEKQAFMSTIGKIGAVIAIPPLATQTEWNQARSDYKAMQAVIATSFTPTQLSNYEIYAYGQMTKEQMDTFAKRHPEVIQIEQAMQEYLLTPGHELLAAYYGSNVTFEKYAKQKFETDHAADGQVFKRYQALAELGKTDDVNKQLANEFYKKNEVSIKRYQADKAKFNKELDNQIDTIRAMLPEPKIASIRPDAEKSIVTQPILSALDKQKADYAGMGKGTASTAHGAPSGGVMLPEDDASIWAKQYTDQFRAEQVKKNDAKAKANGYLTTDNKDVYKLTIQAEVGDAFDNDPIKMRDAFFKTNPLGWKPYEKLISSPTELIDYIGDKGSLREALLTDTTSKWTAIVAFVRQLTPEQLAKLKLDINDIDVVARKAQAYPDSPSEYARSQIVGLDVVFHPDGSITTSEMSLDKYYKNIGGLAGTGGSGSAAKTTKPPTAPRSTGGGSSRGGGSPSYQQQPRISAPVRVDETPALINEWNTFAATLANDAGMLVKLQDYFSAPEAYSLTLLKKDPNLALYISKLDSAQLVRLRKAYLAWAKANGLLGATQQAYLDGAGTGMNLRVYPRRSGRSGL